MFSHLKGQEEERVMQHFPLSSGERPKVYKLISMYFVHRCGPGGSMRACHTAGPGQVFWVRFFRGFSSPARQMSGSLRPQGHEYHLAIIIIPKHSLRAPMT